MDDGSRSADGNAADWDRLRAALREAGVAGVEGLGAFPTTLDERAALPVLLGLLPTLDDPDAVAAVARHLRRPWARPVAFDALLEAFRRWAPGGLEPGWALGDALATSADGQHGPALIEVALDGRFGKARQMVVDSLWRFRASAPVPAVLHGLVEDPDVALHAMSALRRAIGNGEALPRLREIRDTHPDAQVREQAARQVRKAERV